MTGFDFSALQPTSWDTLGHESSALFSTAPWQHVLEQSFGCRTIYALGESGGFAISAFRAGPFRIGYLGFPIGAGIGVSPSLTGLADALRTCRLQGMPVCLRIPVSAFGPQQTLDLPYQANPETAIEDLQNWQLESISKNLRRDIKKAQRSELAVSEVTDPRAADSIYAMYSGTVKRHGGSLRYNADYFQKLIKLSIVQPLLRVFVATRGSDTAGFLVMARHGTTSHYLHGGADPAYRKSSPSDLLLNHAIHAARLDGSETFSLMASPSDQLSLVRYKEKWGGVTRELRTYTLVLRPSYRIFRILEKIYAVIR